MEAMAGARVAPIYWWEAKERGHDWDTTLLSHSPAAIPGPHPKLVEVNGKIPTDSMGFGSGPLLSLPTPLGLPGPRI